MNTTIELGKPGDRLDFEEARRAVRLYPGVGGSQVEITLRMARSVPDDSTQYHVKATLHFSNDSHRRNPVGPLGHVGTVTAGERHRDVELVGFISTEQLRVVDEFRAGRDLWVLVAIEVQWIDTTAGGFRSARGDLWFPVSVGEWSTELDGVEAGGWVELLIPMPDDIAHAQMVQRIKEARQFLRTGDIMAALGAARLALEPVYQAPGMGNLLRQATGKDARQRDLPERFAVMVQATYAVLCGATHDDEITKSFTYTRAEAAALVTTTAGLVNRHARQQP